MKKMKNKNFKQFIESGEYIDSTDAMILISGRTPELLTAIGIENHPVYISNHHIKMITNEYDMENHYHGISTSFLKNINNMINQPAAIYISDINEPKIAVLSKKRDFMENPILIYIRLNSILFFKQVHVVLTVFGRPIDVVTESLTSAEEENRLLFINQMGCFDHYEKCGKAAPQFLHYESREGPFNGIIRKI